MKFLFAIVLLVTKVLAQEDDEKLMFRPQVNAALGASRVAANKFLEALNSGDSQKLQDRFVSTAQITDYSYLSGVHALMDPVVSDSTDKDLFFARLACYTASTPGQCVSSRDGDDASYDFESLDSFDWHGLLGITVLQENGGSFDAYQFVENLDGYFYETAFVPRPNGFTLELHYGASNWYNIDDSFGDEDDIEDFRDYNPDDENVAGGQLWGQIDPNSYVGEVMSFDFAIAATTTSSGMISSFRIYSAYVLPGVQLSDLVDNGRGNGWWFNVKWYMGTGDSNAFLRSCKGGFFQSSPGCTSSPVFVADNTAETLGNSYFTNEASFFPYW